jgi:hypothetical protein
MLVDLLLEVQPGCRPLLAPALPDLRAAPRTSSCSVDERMAADTQTQGRVRGDSPCGRLCSRYWKSTPLHGAGCTPAGSIAYPACTNASTRSQRYGM